MKTKNQLGQIMNENKFSLRQLAKLCGVSRSTLSRICNGDIYPSQMTMILIAHGLKLQVVDIFDLTY